MSLEESFEFLKKSPIFAISLSSKELFHSNFWAWLVEHDPKYAKVFFDDIEVDKIKFVKREEKNRDLSIHTDKNVYIIENKIKSMPSEIQIENYQQKEKNFAKGCLTGVVKLNHLPKGWSFKSYKEIGQAILEINQNSENDKWQFLIEEYAKVIIEIENVLTTFISQHKNKLICNNSKELKPFDDIRFSDVLKKANANDFVNYLNTNVKADLNSLLDNNFYLLIDSGFSDKSAIIDIRIIKNKDTDKQFVIGIQIQNNQYRFCVERKRGTLDLADPNAAQNLFNEFLKHQWFENSDKSKKFKGKSTKMRNQFCKYETSTYKFVYQYYILDGANLNFDKLAEQIKQDMQFAIAIAKKVA